VGEHVLQAVGGGVASVFGELPAVLSAYRAEQAADVVPHPFRCGECGVDVGQSGSLGKAQRGQKAAEEQDQAGGNFPV
jgi:hypothetical protein